MTGEFGSDDDHLFNGILTQAAKDAQCITVACGSARQTDRLKAVRKAIPVSMRNNPHLRLLMSVNDFDEYDDELTAREGKNADETRVNRRAYKEIRIETLAAWPDGLIVATLCSPDAMTTNLFAAVNLQDDEHVIQIGKVSEMSELYFFKMLMKADTNIAFGEEFVVLDKRDAPAFPAPSGGSSEAPTITGPSEVLLKDTATAANRTYATSNGAAIAAEVTEGADWLNVSASGFRVTFTPQAYAYDATEGVPNPRVAHVAITVPGTTASLDVTVNQPMAANV